MSHINGGGSGICPQFTTFLHYRYPGGKNVLQREILANSNHRSIYKNEVSDVWVCSGPTPKTYPSPLVCIPSIVPSDIVNNVFYPVFTQLITTGIALI